MNTWTLKPNHNSRTWRGAYEMADLCDGVGTVWAAVNVDAFAPDVACRLKHGETVMVELIAQPGGQDFRAAHAPHKTTASPANTTTKGDHA